MNRIIFKIILIFSFVSIIGISILYTANSSQKNIKDDRVSIEIKRTYEIESQIRCPSCGGITLDLCELPICREMKKVIATQIETGLSNKEIINFFQLRYGDIIINRTNKFVYIFFISFFILSIVPISLFMKKNKLIK